MKSLQKYNVVVVGGGPSGCHTALAAARGGVKVLLVEQFGFLGGALTSMGVGPMMSFHNRDAEQVIFGSAQELVDRMVGMGASTGHIFDTTGYCSTVTPFDSEGLKIALEEMLLEAGVEILYHTRLIDAERDSESGKITALTLHNRGGMQRVESDIYVDASGDGELIERADIEYTLGREDDNKTQPMTMNLKVSGVDSQKLREYIANNWDQFVDKEREGEGVEILTKSNRLSMWGFYDLWQKAKDNGEVSIPRNNVLFFETNSPGVYIFNTSRVLDLNPTDAFDLSRAETIGRRQCWELFKFLKKYIPGFENSTLVGTPAHIGIRESRHPKALYELRAEDLIKGIAFDDRIALGGYPIDIHSPDGGDTDTTQLEGKGIYSIPVRSLLVDDCENLLLVGRAIGADHHASAAIRLTPIAMAVGQGAGVLAALAVKSCVMPHKVSYSLLREGLLSAGARLDY
ncbi:MAG: FAD-dependent oxidoreductase [Rikenellaceae bacterium]